MKVSVVVVVKNEGLTIERLIFSLAAQTIRPDELIIVDAGSEDETVPSIERWAQSHGLSKWIRVLRMGEVAFDKARQAGGQLARNPWIAFTSYSVRVEPMWLEHLIEQVRQDESVDVVCGSYEAYTENWMGECSAQVILQAKEERSGQGVRGPSIASMMIHRSVLEKVDPLPERDAWEGRQFLTAIERERLRLVWAPRAIAWRQMPGSPGQLFHHLFFYSKRKADKGCVEFHRRIAAWNILLWLVLIISIPWLEGWALPVLASLLSARTLWKSRGQRERCKVYSSVWLASFITVLGLLIVGDLAILSGWSASILRRYLLPTSVAERLIRVVRS